MKNHRRKGYANRPDLIEEDLVEINMRIRETLTDALQMRSELDSLDRFTEQKAIKWATPIEDEWELDLTSRWPGTP